MFLFRPLGDELPDLVTAASRVSVIKTLSPRLGSPARL
jgi:hypothetical protein